MKFRSPNLYTIIIVAKIKKCFSKEKERIKGFSIFFLFFMFIVSLFICYDLSKLNRTVVGNNPANELVVGLLRFLIVRILNTVSMVLFFQFELKMAVHAARTKRICEVNNF